MGIEITGSMITAALAAIGGPPAIVIAIKSLGNWLAAKDAEAGAAYKAALAEKDASIAARDAEIARLHDENKSLAKELVVDAKALLRETLEAIDRNCDAVTGAIAELKRGKT